MRIPKSNSVSEPDFISSIEAILANAQIPGAVVAMVNGDESIVIPYGSRKLGENDPIDPETTFSIASCSKAFTALAVLLLMDQGLLDIDDPAKRYLPELEMDRPELTAKITIRDLLGMRLGLQSVGVLAWGRNRDVAHSTVLSRLKYLPRIAGFGKAYTYLNTAYTALALLVERVSGTTFAEFLQTRIFAPLDMTDAFLSERAVSFSNNCSFPHVSDGDDIVSLAVPYCGGREGESCLYLSGRDASQWLRFCLSAGVDAEGERLISMSAWSQMISPQVRAEPISGLNQSYLSYGMGWHLCDLLDYSICCHEGGEMGVSTHTLICREANIGVAVYANLAVPAAVKGITFGVFDALTTGSSCDWQRKHERVAAERTTSDAHVLDSTRQEGRQCARPATEDIVGLYHSDHSGFARLYLSEGKLKLVVEQGRLYDSQLVHESGDVFKVICDDLGMRSRAKLIGIARLVSNDTQSSFVLNLPGLGQFRRV